MAIDRLSLTDFRSYADAVVAAGPSFVVLTGANGAGKTNILEAISLLAPGRGLRGVAMNEIARRDGKGGFGVSALLRPLPFRGGVGVGQSLSPDTDRAGENVPHPNPSPEGEGLIALGTGALPAAPERRIVRINGATRTASALTEWLSLVWLTPAQDRLFSDSAGARRRFLDRLVLALHPDHARHSARYEAAMRQRNRLLAEGNFDDAWLTALETAMGEHGIAIRRARMETVKDIVSAQDMAESSFPRFRLLLDHVPDDLATRLAAGRQTHAAAGRTLVGPHTSDLHVRYADKDQPAAQSSTGEQKALLIGIILAHADLVAERTQRRPILLLDEVAAHLDPARRAALFDRLSAGGGQVWLTGTEPDPFSAIGPSATWLTVAEGRVFSV